MKRFFSLSLLFALLGISVVSADPVRILGIGNSFTVDALEQHFQPMLDAQGKQAVIGYPYRGGTWLCQHDAWSNRTDTLPYNYRKFVNGRLTTTGLATYNLSMAMADEPWDWVVIQSDHDSAGIYVSYVPYMEHLIDYVHAHCTNPNVKIAFYMTWAYDATSTYGAFSYYRRNQQLMYDSIVACAQRVMAQHPDVEVLIPAGTAVQNARTGYLGERLNRDGYHLHYEHGRYIASLCWYEALFGESALDVVYQPATLTDYCADLCRHAAHAAHETPYAVTSLADEYGEEQEDPIEPGTESHLRRMTVNGMTLPLTEDATVYTAQVDYTLTNVSLYAYPIDSHAELNITDAAGADIERDPTRPWYYPLVTPAQDDTVTYTIRVISEAMGSNETIYTLHLIGAAASTLTYPIASREDLENFALAVNGGSYSIQGVLTADFDMSHTPQDCWMTPIGTDAHPYTGTFDGAGHTISGFNLYSVDNTLSTLRFVGLFGYIRGATVKNLTIIGSQESYFNRSTGDTKQNNAYGILCGAFESSTIQDCAVSMPIFTNVAGHVGMLCGRNADAAGSAPSLIERCYTEGTWRIRYTGIYGGLIGYGYNMTVRNCYTVSTMSLQQDRSARIGGILGYVNASNGRAVTLINCHSYGSLTDDRVKYGAATTQTPYLGAVASVFNGTAVTAVNCWYLAGSAPEAFAQHKSNTQSASAATAAQFADGTVATALGTAFAQGDRYPILAQPQHTTALEDVFSFVHGTSSLRTLDRPMKVILGGEVIIVREGHAYRLTGEKIF